MTETTSIPMVMAARAYVQTRFFPPLPAAYGDLLVTALSEYNEYGADSHVNIDPDLNPLPRDVQVDEDGDLYIDAGDLIRILRAEHMLDDEETCPNCGGPARENAYGTSCDQWPLCEN